MKNILPILFLILFVILSFLAFSEGSDSKLYTTATAVISLAISLFGFYFQNIRSIHKLSFTLVDLSFNGKFINAYCTFENLGTNEEIIVGGTFIFPKEGTNEYSTITRNAGSDNLPELMKPFILKPKQIELENFKWQISFDDLLIHFHRNKGDTFEQVVKLKIDFINPETRAKSAKLINIGTIKFYKDFADFNKIRYRQTQLFEGKLQPI